MKLSILLITGTSDREGLDTVQNIINQNSGLTGEIFLIISGDFNDENRKKLYLEHTAVFGMTAFINQGGKSDAELLNTFIRYANADLCTVMRAGSRTDPGFFAKLIHHLDTNEELNIAFGQRIAEGIENFTPSGRGSNEIDLSKEYGCFPCGLEGTVIRTSFAAEHPFEQSAEGYAEELGIFKMVSACDKLWYDSSIKIWLPANRQYILKELEDMSSLPEDTGREYFCEVYEKCLLPLNESCKGKDGRLPLTLQHLIAAAVLKTVNEGMYARKTPELDRIYIMSTLTKALSAVEDKVICNVYGVGVNHALIDEIRIMLGLKHGHENYYTEMCYGDGRLYAAQKDIIICDNTQVRIRIKLLDGGSGTFLLDGEFTDVFNERRTKVVAEYGGKEHKLTYDRKGTATILFGKETIRDRSFRLKLDADENKRQELKFFILFKGCKYELKASFGDIASKLRDGDEGSFFPLGKGIYAYAEGGRMVTAPMDDKEIRRRERIRMSHAAAGNVPFTLRAAYACTRFWFRKKNIWMFADDPVQGGGAAEDMFRYAMTRHDELYCYYLTEKGSPAAQQLLTDGYKPLYKGTLLHKLLFLNAQVYLTTRPDVVMQNIPGQADISYSLTRQSDTTVVMLQNSTSDKPDKDKHKRSHDNVRLFFCGTKSYTDELSEQEYGYSGTDAVRLTGLTSYDDIKDTSGEDRIIFMTAKYTQQGTDFAKSEFFSRYSSVINNERLQKALKDSGCRLAFAMEGVTNEECKGFGEHENILLLTDDFSISEHKSKAKLIVTDDANEYEAAVMKKPLIFYGCDDGMDYAVKAEDSDKLVELLCERISEGLTVSEEQRAKEDAWFGSEESGVRRRIYNDIITFLYESGRIDGYEDFGVADKYDEENYS